MIRESIYRLAKRSVQSRKMLESVFFYIIGLPLIGNLYDSVYFSRVIRLKSLSIPKWIAIEGYNLCNLRCVDCPYPIMTRPKVQMPFSLFQSIIENCVEVGIRRVRLHNYGEPFLDSLLFDRIEFAKSKGMFVSLNTNGTLLTTPKIERTVECGLDEIIFSVDGISKEVFERIRVGAQYDTIVASINELIACRRRRKSKNPLVIVSCIVQKYNYHEMMEQPQKFHELFNDVDITEMALADNRRDESQLISNGLMPSSRWSLVYPCAEIWRSLTVLSSGDVVLCCLDYDGSVKLGNLSRQGIEEIWHSKNFQDIKQLHLNRQGEMVELCKNCPYIHGYGAIEWLLDL